MMNIFKKLFGKKESEPKAEKQSVNEQKFDLSSEVASREIFEPDIQTDIVQKDYDISEIKQHSTHIKNKDGYTAAVDFIKDFITQNDIEFKELISLLKKAIPYMKKESTIENVDIIDYIEVMTDKFSNEISLEYQADIADLFSRVDNLKAIEYLERILGDIRTDESKSLEHFDLLIQLSDYYLVQNQGDEAFITIRRAGLLIKNTKSKFDYLWKQKILAERSAAICLEGQKKPMYSDYLHYTIVAFFIHIAIDANGFPSLSDFFRIKNLCFNKGWGFQDDDNFNKALEDLNIATHKQEFLNDIYEYAFNELPIQMGIPKEYLNEDLHETLSNLTNDFVKNYTELRKISDAKDEYNQSQFTVSQPHQFAKQVVQKYYEQENDTN